MGKNVNDNAKFQTGEAIQALPLNTSIHHAIVIGAAAVRKDITGAIALRMATDSDCYILFGDNTVTVTSANGAYFPAGAEILLVPEGATHISYIQNATAGIGTITQVGES